MPASSPELSAILVTPDGIHTVRKTLRHLHAQTARDRIELVLAAPSAEQIVFGTEHGVEDLCGVQVVEVGELISSAAARAAAIRQARAPVVALMEDHCFPEPDWAERILAAHRDEWAVVGPVLRNANPQTPISWANMIIEYGPWLVASEPAEVQHLPGHNSAYKRDVLLAYGDDLAAMLEAESVLHWDLRADGYRLLHDPTIRTHHLNFSLLPNAMGLRFIGGRMFAASRARAWPLWRRLLYTAGAPLIPLIRLRRALRHARSYPDPNVRLLRLGLSMLILLIADASGEAVGYALGEGRRTKQRLTTAEFHRDRNVRPEEHHLAFE